MHTRRKSEGNKKAAQNAALLYSVLEILPAQQVSKYQRGDNSCIAFYYKFRGMYIQLAPGYFLVWHSAAVRAIRGSAVAYLAEVAPEWYIVPLQVLVHHRYYANREVAGYATAYLEESYTLSA